MDRRFLIVGAIMSAMPLVRGETTTLPFTAAMTNECGWIWNQAVKSNSKGYYVGAQNAMIVSPTWGTAITSVVLKVSPSSSCTRNLIWKPGEEEFTVTSAVSSITVNWERESQVRLFSFESTSGASNLYLDEITIFAEDRVERPRSVTVSEIHAQSALVNWQVEANVVSSRVDLAEIATIPAGYTRFTNYPFTGLVNESTSAVACEQEFYDNHPLFDGVNLYVPANATNEIQLSNSKSIGYLVYHGGSYANLTMCVRAKHYDYAKECTTMSVGYAQAGVTNQLGTLELGTEFTEQYFSLKDIPEGADLILNSFGNKANHRVIIDDLGFYEDLTPESIATNLLSSTMIDGSSLRLRTLKVNTPYLVRVAACDQENFWSEPSDWVDFRTAEGLQGLTLLLW